MANCESVTGAGFRAVKLGTLACFRASSPLNCNANVETNALQSDFYESAKLISKEANDLKLNGDFKQMEERLTRYMNQNTNTVLSTLNDLLKV